MTGLLEIAKAAAAIDTSPAPRVRQRSAPATAEPTRAVSTPQPSTSGGMTGRGRLLGVVGSTEDGLLIVDPEALGVEVEELNVTPLLEKLDLVPRSAQKEAATQPLAPLVLNFHVGEQRRRAVRIERDAAGGMRLVPEDDDEGASA
jgi:hypothetical protein